MKHCIVFDLDGTLCDTLDDIANSVNMTRMDYGLSPLPAVQICTYVGDGARKLLERSFADHPIDFEQGLSQMIRHYADYPAVHTRPYPGVMAGLAELKRRGWNLAAVTNKPGLVARKILAQLQISVLLDDVIGGGDGFALKPSPEAVLYLLKKYSADPSKSWVLGDNHTDLDCAVNAGMQGAFATWGYGTAGCAKYTICVDSFAGFAERISGT